MDNVPNTQVKPPQNYQQTQAPSNPSNNPSGQPPSLTTIPNGQVLRGKRIASGGFGIIYAGSWKTFQVAIKVLKDRNLNNDLKQEFFNESKIMSSLKHSRVVHFFGICTHPYAMIMELMPMGDLSNLLSNFKQQLPWAPKRWQWALDIGSGLAYLHSQKILHRDLKSQNVLLDENLRAKITDFGLSRIKAQSKLYTQNQAGSLPWMAPELFARRAQLTPASDVYAYAMTLWEIAARRIPFVSSLKGRDINVIRAWVKEDRERPDLPKECPTSFANIITACWAQDPEKRPSAIEALKMLQQAKPQTVPNLDTSPTSFSKIIEILRVLTTFIGRKDHLATLKKDLIDGWTPKSFTRLHVLTGLGGVGKSELACQFANQFIKQFDLIYWIPGETQLQRQSAFSDLAAKLGIRLEKDDSYTAIRNKVYKTLEGRPFKQPYLLIFDNLEEKETFPFGKGSILITAQNSTLYDPRQVLTVNSFTEQEAIQLVQAITKDTDLANIKTLVNALGNFPLAIDKACAYIVQKNITISNYLQTIDVQALLKESGTKRHERSLLATWQLTLKALDPLAVQWLNLCAYLAPDDIPAAWITHWLNKQKQEENKKDTLLGSLRSYGLISFSHQGGFFSIHRLLQHILRIPGEEQHYQGAISILAKVSQQFYHNKIETWEIGSALLPHAKAFFIHNVSKKANQKKLALLLYNMGEIEQHFANYNAALTYYKQALVIEQKVYGDEHPDVVASLMGIGNALYSRGKYDEALTLYKQALVIYKKMYGDEHPRITTSLNNIGLALNKLGKYDEALTHYKQALAIRKKMYGDEHPSVATSLNNTGGVLNSLGKYDEALTLYKQALAIRKKMYGDEHPSMATSLNNIGSALNYQGKYDEALTTHKQALVIYKKMYGNEHPHVASSLNNIGSVLNSLRKYAEALTYYKQALVIEQKVYSDEHPSVATSLNNIGSALNSLGKCTEALTYYKKSLETLKKVYGNEHPRVASSLYNIGSALNNLEKVDEALVYYKQCLAVEKKVYGDEHPELDVTKKRIAAMEQKIRGSQSEKPSSQQHKVFMERQVQSDKRGCSIQ